MEAATAECCRMLHSLSCLFVGSVQGAVVGEAAAAYAQAGIRHAPLHGRHTPALVRPFHPPQARANLEDTKKKITESEKRIDAELGAYINKKYW